MTSSVQYMTNQSEIRPFRIEIPQADLADLRARLASTRWPSRPRIDDWSRGVPLDYLRQLAEHWATGFDWPAHEAAPHDIPQFTTEIGAQTIHSFHVRPPEPEAPPLVLPHHGPRTPGELTTPLAH